MPKHIVYPVALLEFCLQNLTLYFASVSRHSPQVFYVYVTPIFLKIILFSSQVIHRADTELWILYNPLLNLCVQHDFVHDTNFCYMQPHTLSFTSSRIKSFRVPLYMNLNLMVLHYYLILTHKMTYKLDVGLAEMQYEDQFLSAFVREHYC
jgi:hypothetical protein